MNEPGNDSMVPFQHPLQEGNLRHQYNYGIGPMGSDRPGSSAQAHAGNALAHA